MIASPAVASASAPAPVTLRTLYRSMRVDQLLLLQQAFLLDGRETDSPICRAFCEARLALIYEVLKEKAARKAERRAQQRAGKEGSA